MARKAIIVKFGLASIAIGIAWKLGILDFMLVHILGKSTDLTGRAYMWPIIWDNFDHSGQSLLGGGFGAFLGTDLAEMDEASVDNGYLDKLIEFGYLCSPVVFATFAAVLWSGTQINSDHALQKRDDQRFSVCYLVSHTVSEYYGEQLYDEVLEHRPNVDRGRHNFSAAAGGY